MIARLAFEFESLVLVSQWGSCDESTVELMVQQFREQLPFATEITIGDVTIGGDTLKQGKFKFQLSKMTPDIYRELLV